VFVSNASANLGVLLISPNKNTKKNKDILVFIVNQMVRGGVFFAKFKIPIQSG
jgi:hypothetical protein